MGGKLDDLSELSKNLSIPPVSDCHWRLVCDLCVTCNLNNAHQHLSIQNHPRPEEYIRETLLAHGFFGHVHPSEYTIKMTS